MVNLSWRRWRVRIGRFLGGLIGLAFAAQCGSGTAPPGALDETFQPWIEILAADGAPAPGEVRCLALQADEGVLVGGLFRRVNGVARTNLARLNRTGALDPAFAAGTNPDGAVNTMVVRPDGGIWIGGNFTRVNGERRVGLARLKPDGTLDHRFELVPEMEGAAGALAFLPGDQLLCGGRFTVLSLLPLRRHLSLIRLNAMGVIDDGFRAELVDPEIVERFGRPEVRGIFPQPSGRVVVQVRSPLAAPGNASLWSLLPDGQREWGAFGFFGVSRVGLAAFPYRIAWGP